MSKQGGENKRVENEKQSKEVERVHEYRLQFKFRLWVSVATEFNYPV